LLWTPGYWAWRDDGVYVWRSGYWGPRVGFYGGVNYGYGYTGSGYYGGYWSGRVFTYNTAVTNVGSEHHDIAVAGVLREGDDILHGEDVEHARLGRDDQ
jgi:hypothetical protein